MSVSGDSSLSCKGITLSLDVGITLHINGQCCCIVFGICIVVELNDGAKIVRAVVGNFLRRNDTAICNHADLASHNDLTGILFRGNEVIVLAKCSKLLRMNENDLFGVDFLFEEVNGINDTCVADFRARAVMLKLCALQCSHSVAVYLCSDSLCKLIVGLTNGITIAGKNRFVGQFNGSHCLLNLCSGGGCSQLYGLSSDTFCDIFCVADVCILGNGDGVTGYALKGSVDLCERCNNDLLRNFCADHISHYLRIDEISDHSSLICHNRLPSFFFSYLVISA